MTDVDRAAELRRQIVAVLRASGADHDPIDLVEEIPVLEEIIEEIADERIADARAAGASWADIAARLGVTRQAAHQRFGRRRGARLEIRLERGKRG